MPQQAELLFVGEKPSRTAEQRSLTWTDGKLAAKTLFDALESAGIERSNCTFFNLFGMTADAPEHGPTVDANIKELVNIVAGRTIVAMGLKVAKHLERHNIPHKRITHPAARGKIRAKHLYAAHVAEVLRTPSIG